MRIRNVRLTITERCNLNCVYCYEKHKSAAEMSTTTAKCIVDSELSRTDEIDQLNFEFFGGEPFLNFPLIKKISEYIWSKKVSVGVSIAAVTNGTAFTNEVKRWLFDHKNQFDLGLSIDSTITTICIHIYKYFFHFYFLFGVFPGFSVQPI